VEEVFQKIRGKISDSTVLTYKIVRLN